MTADEYFNELIPHRLNLLLAFRTRYSDSQSPHVLNPETYRDLFRCAKDVCFLMTRFLSGELGVYYCEKSTQFKDAQKWASRFGSTRVPLAQLRSDRRYPDLCQMYQAANQAVAHVDPHRVDHSFRIAPDDLRMVAVINWIEELVRKHIYADAGRDLSTAMNLLSNRNDVRASPNHSLQRTASGVTAHAPTPAAPPPPFRLCFVCCPPSGNTKV